MIQGPGWWVCSVPCTSGSTHQSWPGPVWISHATGVIGSETGYLLTKALRVSYIGDIGNKASVFIVIETCMHLPFQRSSNLFVTLTKRSLPSDVLNETCPRLVRLWRDHKSWRNLALSLFGVCSTSAHIHGHFSRFLSQRNIEPTGGHPHYPLVYET